MTEITPLFTQLTIAGVDLTAYMNDYDIEDTFKNRTGNMIKLYMNNAVTAVATFKAGDEIVLSEGTVTSTDYVIFRGKLWRSQPNDTEIEITARDKLHEFGGDYFTVTYDYNIDPEAGVLSAIFQDIVEDGGYTASVVDSGTDLILKRYRSRDKTRLDRLATLAKILDWGMRVDYDNQYIALQPKGYTSFSTPLVVGANVFNVPVWDENVEPMKNKIKIKGAFEDGTITTSFVGDGVTTNVNLTYNPTGTTTLVNTTTSTPLRRGIPGTVDEGDYQVDVDLKTITFTVAPIVADNISIEYVARLPKDVEGENTTSIASTSITMGDVYEFKDIQNVDDAETRLSQLLALIGQPLVSTSLNVNRTLNIKPGQVVSVTDPETPSKSSSYVVTSVKRNYTDPFIVVKIGDTDFDVRDLYESIDARLQAIEDSELADTTILRQLIQTQGDFINVVVRDEDLWTRSSAASPTVMYWDNPAQDLWGSYNWASPDTGDLATDGYSLVRRTQGFNTFTELMRDSDYYDSVNSTGVTWNTTTKTITINAGTLYTKVVALGIAYTYVTFDIGASTGTYVVYVSADNKATWQIITPGVRTLLTSSLTTGLYFKITSAGVSTLLNVTIANPVLGIYETPAIEAVLEA